MKFTLLVPTLNEIDSIQVVMPQIKREWFDQILIVDGGSTDGTIEWFRSNGYEVLVQASPGLRRAYQQAMPLVKGDAVITFSPDGNSLADRLPALMAKLTEGYDMVIVSRYIAGAESEDDDFVTAFGNRFFTTLLNVLYGSRYTDAMVMYRGYRRELFYALKFDSDGGFTIPERLFSTRVSIEPMMSLRVAKYKLKVTEIPGDEPARIGGKRKLQIVRWGLVFLWQFIVERFRR